MNQGHRGRVSKDADMQDTTGGRLYSVGYEGLTLSSFIERLAQNAVTCVVDVRLTPASRRPGFSKARLAAALEEGNIVYVHERDLGNPPENRDAFRLGSELDAGRQRMRRQLADGGASALARVTELARQTRVALLCVERDEPRCHRSVIIDELLARAPEVDVIRML
jgi:uncharacterized protein (DUF488 family)